MDTLLLFLGIVLSYISGSLPTGYLFGKILKGIDIREHGSGNPGATNVFRVVGKTAGAATLLIDFLKGFIPVQIAKTVFPGNDYLISLIGFSAIAGHNWTLFLNFRGGKGVATSTGVFMAIVPFPTLIAVGFFLISFLTTRHVSVGSMVGVVSLCVSTWFLTQSKFLTLLTTACALLIFVLHKKNIARLINKEEHKISFSDKKEIISGKKL